MKILLLTYSFNYNYGGLLQAYATVRYLESQGHKVVIPDCAPAHMIGNTSFFRGLGIKASNPIKAVLRRLRQLSRYRKFDQFRSGMPIDKSLTSKSAISSAASNGRFDIALTGSDQTWNTKFMPSYNSYYYQGFLEGNLRKVSYASCFGTREQKPELLQSAAPDIIKFNSIAVRNSVSREIVHDLTGLEALVVVDPTLLHDFAEFRLENSATDRKFVMVYGLDTSNFKVAAQIIKELRARHPGIEVDFVNGEKNFEKPSWATNLVNSYGPIEFLQAIQAASYLVTDSFHGVIFAQKFGTPCLVYSSGWRAERIISVMRDFGCEDLLIQADDAATVARIVEEVQANGRRLRATDELSAKIRISKKYLEESLDQK